MAIIAGTMPLWALCFSYNYNRKPIHRIIQGSLQKWEGYTFELSSLMTFISDFTISHPTTILEYISCSYEKDGKIRIS